MLGRAKMRRKDVALHLAVIGQNLNKRRVPHRARNEKAALNTPLL
jgi:hypothetical protein